MVRKAAKLSDKGLQSDPPYPSTPISPSHTGQIAGQLVRQNDSIKNSPNQDFFANGADSTDAWATIPRPSTNNELPQILRATEGRNQTKTILDTNQEVNGLPQSLQVGNINLTPRSSSESQRSAGLAENQASIMNADRYVNTFTSQNQYSNNPFLRTKNAEDAVPKEINPVGENSMDVWANAPKTAFSQNLSPSKIQNTDAITTSQAFSQPWIDFSSSSAEQAPFEPNAPTLSPKINTAVPSNAYQELSGNPFQDLVPDKQENNLDALKSNANYGTPIATNSYASELQELEGRWPGSIADFPPHDFNKAGEEAPTTNPQADDIGPRLPPRRLQENEDIPPPQPPRPPLENLRTSSSFPQTQLPPTTQQNDAANQRNKTYQIRLVNWFDASSPINPRSSPIMVQNANGPCPLLALVNALILSTPFNQDTTLVETLRVREQISLGFLLDAVIDELMSGRRGDAAQNLPDVSDLYTFLVNLHTGMNVNPTFVQLESEVTNLLDAPIIEPSTHLNLLRAPGSFEDTKEMRLYSTFAVPLIHGWIPSKNHPAHAALKRAARNYEEAQNLMFREEELEDKLQQQGLSQSEQLILEDISTVKHFLSSSATQLTGYGLDTITETLGSGSIAILFRNDHFSTLYKHPQSGQLFTLVTDMGYAGHDEVVWESLVDVSGEGCELFAGDFRPVGNVSGDDHLQPNNVNSNDNSAWTTVSRSNDNSKSRNSLPTTSIRSQVPNQSAPDPSHSFSLLSIDEPIENLMSPTTEQEDHDLALALQLQEEEEDRERRETAARRHEDELSQAYLKTQKSPSQRGPARTSSRDFNGEASRRQYINSLASQQLTTPSKPKSADVDVDAPPPSYEQAAKGPVYHPPSGAYDASPTAATGRSNSGVSRFPGTRPQRQNSAYSPNSATTGGFPFSNRRSADMPTLAPSPVVGRGTMGRRCSSGRYADLARGGPGGNGGGGGGGGGGSSRGDGGGAGVGSRRRGPVPSTDDDKKDCTVM